MGALIQLREGATLLNFPRAAQSARSLIAAALKYHRLPELLAEALLREIGAGDNPELLLAAALGKRMHVQPIDFEKARGICCWVRPAPAKAPPPRKSCISPP